MFNIVNCKYTLLYREESHTGRCRLSLESFRSADLKLTVGCIVKIRLHHIEGKFSTILCTAWPSGFNDLPIDTIVADETVVFGSGLLDYVWTDCKGEIVEVYQPMLCTSLQLVVKSAVQNTAKSIGYTGLPVCDGVTIRYNKASRTKDNIVIKRCQPSTPCLITPFSLISYSPASSISSSSSNQLSLTQTSTTVNTRLVNELIKILIKPLLFSSASSITRNNPNLSIHGVLITGPPGCGKTHSAIAVQSICHSENMCQVNIYELSIPELLSLEDPLQYIDSVFVKAQTSALSRRHSVSKAITDTKNNISAKSPKTPMLYTPQRHTKQSSSSLPSSSLLLTPFTESGSLSRHDSFRFATPQSNPISQSSFKINSTAIPHDDSNQLSVVFAEMSIVVIDEIDALGRCREQVQGAANTSGGGGGGGQSEVQIAIIDSLCRWFDRLNNNSSNHAQQAVNCCVLATTNRPEDVDTRLRRGGRLEREIEVMTTRTDRTHILIHSFKTIFQQYLSDQLLIEDDVFKLIQCYGDRLGGYVAADCQLLVRETAILFLQNFHNIDVNASASADQSKSRELHVYMSTLLEQSFESAIQLVPPSSLRGVTVSVPRLRYSDIIGYEDIKKHLRRLLLFSSPTKREIMQKMKIKFPGGILLHGPPGNSKTTLILATASTYGLPVISLSAADVYSPYVGDAEAEIRKAFRVARQSSPCILLLDEIDALVTNRDAGNGSSGSGSGVSTESRVLATLLTEMDGVLNTAGSATAATAAVDGGINSYDDIVYVFATTNRLDSIDAALLRKGRLYQVLHVPLPTNDDQIALIKFYSGKYSLSDDIVEKLCNKLRIIHPSNADNRHFGDNDITNDTTKNANVKSYSGADIENMCREEGMDLVRKQVQRMMMVNTKVI